MVDFESLVERSPILYTVIKSDGTIHYQSGATERLCGYGCEELVGEPFLEYVHPHDRSDIERIVRNPADATVGKSIRYRFRHANETWIRLETSADPIPEPESGGHVVVSQERDERTDLKRERDRYEDILESLDDSVYAIDPDLNIVYANEAFAARKGVEREELLGTDIRRWGTTETNERIIAAREELETPDDVAVVEYESRNADNDQIPVENRFTTVARSETELERVGVVRDISERKARESALNRKNERLEEFASIVSHDLRNPLNVAEGYLELVRDNCDNDHLDEVAAAHDRMATLIEDLLALAREGETVTETDAVDLAAAIERSWQGVVTETASLEVETDRTIVGDEARLWQLLENLVRNAVEHGGSDVTVTVGDLEDGFFVEDDGPGIPTDERERIFEPGYSSTDDGTGFGLGIVNRIATAHGWNVAVAADDVGGARFEITGVTFARSD